MTRIVCDLTLLFLELYNFLTYSQHKTNMFWITKSVLLHIDVFCCTKFKNKSCSLILTKMIFKYMLYNKCVPVDFQNRIAMSSLNLLKKTVQLSCNGYKYE